MLPSQCPLPLNNIGFMIAAVICKDGRLVPEVHSCIYQARNQSDRRCEETKARVLAKAEGNISVRTICSYYRSQACSLLLDKNVRRQITWLLHIRKFGNPGPTEAAKRGAMVRARSSHNHKNALQATLTPHTYLDGVFSFMVWECGLWRASIARRHLSSEGSYGLDGACASCTVSIFSCPTPALGLGGLFHVGGRF